MEPLFALSLEICVWSPGWPTEFRCAFARAWVCFDAAVALTFFDVLLSFDVKRRFWNIAVCCCCPDDIFLIRVTPYCSARNDQNQIHAHNDDLHSQTVLKLQVTSFKPLSLPIFKPLLQFRCEMRFPVTGFPLAHKSPIHLILPLLLELLVQVLKMRQFLCKGFVDDGSFATLTSKVAHF